MLSEAFQKLRGSREEAPEGEEDLFQVSTQQTHEQFEAAGASGTERPLNKKERRRKATVSCRPAGPEGRVLRL